MRDIGGLFVGLIVVVVVVAAVTAPGCGRTDEASGADVRFVVDEAKTDAYIASLDLAAFERAGTDFTSPMHDPTRIGKALDEIDPSGECDHAQLAAIERRLDGVDRRRVLEHIFRLATHDATTNTERHLALLSFMHRASYHCRYLRPMYPDGTRCWDPLVSLEMGEMHCTHAARLAVDLWEAAGYDARCVNFGIKTSAEVFYDGAWHYFGADSVGGNGLSLFKADGTIPSWKELSEKPEWIDTLPYRYELNNRGTPRVAGTPVRSSHCFHERGGGEPMYHAKRRPAVPGEFNYGWAQEQTFPPDWVMADAPERFQPGVVEFRRIDVAPESPGRVVATLEWTVRDRDDDVRGFRVYVSSTSRGWDYSKFAGTREAQRFWSITTGWRPEMYDALYTMPPSDLDVITTTTGRVDIEMGVDEVRYVTIMAFDAYHERIGKTMYLQSNEIRLAAASRD
ncbi:MAG: hypothetical protein KDA25_06140 [Phycisphaerales bacterium]|nr:hypothetical protein [Phycisphaerales bacterium]